MAGRRDFNGPALAFKKRLTQLLFKFGNLLAQRGLRNRTILGRPGKTSMLNDLDEVF